MVVASNAPTLSSAVTLRFARTPLALPNLVTGGAAGVPEVQLCMGLGEGRAAQELGRLLGSSEARSEQVCTFLGGGRGGVGWRGG